MQEAMLERPLDREALFKKLENIIETTNKEKMPEEFLPRDALKVAGGSVAGAVLMTLVMNTERVAQQISLVHGVTLLLLSLAACAVLLYKMPPEKKPVLVKNLIPKRLTIDYSLALVSAFLALLLLGKVPLGQFEAELAFKQLGLVSLFSVIIASTVDRLA